MVRRLFVLVALLLLVGASGCRGRCCPRPCPPPCPRPCPPVPPPYEEPCTPPGGGSGDTNCQTWCNDDCDPVTDGNQTRLWISGEILRLATASSTITAAELKSVAQHVGQHLRDRNCKGNADDPAPSSPYQNLTDCAGMGVVNVTCFAQALNHAKNDQWPQCIIRLQQGH